MARYIKAVECADIISERFNIPLDDLVDVFAEIPTADVVPKSEVEKWKEINEQLFKEMSEKSLLERKIERKFAVMRIIGEILLNHTPDADGFLYIHRSELDELKKKYTEETK